MDSVLQNRFEPQQFSFLLRLVFFLINAKKILYQSLLKKFGIAAAIADAAGVGIVLINKLADPRGHEAFDLLKAKFKDAADTIATISQFEAQFKQATTNRPKP